MINPVGLGIGAGIGTGKLRDNGKAGAVGSVAGTGSESVSVSASPAARMAAQGAPVDVDRIAAIKSAIASGNYPVDPKAIAQKMLDLDLPRD